MKIAWFSAGITSAVATKLALEKYDDVEIFYIDIASQHSDNARFISECSECSEWYGQEINIVTNKKGYKDQYDVIEHTKYVNGAGGARCTLELKKKVRYMVEDQFKPDADELNPDEGILNPIVPDCGMFCQLEFEELMDKNVKRVIDGEIDIYQAAK